MPIYKPCEVCGKTIKTYPSRLARGNGRFCSRDCKDSHDWSTPIEERFWPKVDRRGPDDCWEWVARRIKSGYGMIDRSGLAHRVSWELANGPIPGRLFVLHSCDNPPCVNPKHLWLGTHLDNMRDMREKGRAGGKSANRPRGTQVRTSKLDEEKVHLIRRLATEGGSSREIAKTIGVASKNTILSVLNGKTWAHVTE